jgi:hypothetical protein
MTKDRILSAAKAVLEREASRGSRSAGAQRQFLDSLNPSGKNK